MPSTAMIKQHLESNTFDERTKILKTTWRFEGFDPSTGDFDSDPFGHHENAVIKWILSANPSSKSFAIKSVSSESTKYSFELRLNHRYPRDVDTGTYSIYENSSYGGQFIERSVDFWTTGSGGHHYVDFYMKYLSEESLEILDSPIDDFYFRDPELRNNFCDVEFLLDNGKHAIPAHRVILASKSDVFKKMFTQKFNESQQTGANGIKQIKITDFMFEPFKQFLDILYTKETPDPSDEVCLEVIAICDKYNIQDIKLNLECLVVRSLDMSNSIQVLIAGHLYKADKIKSAALDFIKRNPVTKMKDWNLLFKYPELMKEVLETKDGIM